MFAGGEFYIDPAWIRDAPTISTAGMYFLNGGTACLTVIGDFLRDQGIDRVLLPAYLCPSIARAFERRGLAWNFYQVNEDFTIDLADLASKTRGFRAVYFINYFGFFHSPETQSFFERLKQNGVIVIEDNAQAGFANHHLGDFVLNSIRKLAPYDGGYLITGHDMRPYIDRYRGLPNRRLPLIREYRQGLGHYLFEDSGDYEHLTGLFERATQYYEDDLVVLGDEEERRQIERLDWPGIRQIRRENYRYLLEWVTLIPEIKPVFPALQADNLPLGLPVYLPDGLRDRVYEELGNAGIGLTIHWEEIRSDPRTNGNPPAVEMASHILTLPIDQSTRRKQMDYLAENLIRAIAVGKTG